MEAEVLNHRYGMASILDGKLACSVMDGSNGYVNPALIPKAFLVQDTQFQTFLRFDELTRFQEIMLSHGLPVVASQDEIKGYRTDKRTVHCLTA